MYILELCQFVKQRPNLKRGIVINPGSTRIPDGLVLDYSPAVKIFSKVPSDLKALPINQMYRQLEK